MKPPRRWVFPALMLLSFACGIVLGAGLNLRRFVAPRREPASSLRDAGAAFPLPPPAAARTAAPTPAPARAFDADSLLAIASQNDELRAACAAMPNTLRWAVIQQLMGRAANRNRNTVIAAVFQSAAVSDPVRAIRMLGPMPRSVFRSELGAEMVGTWIDASPEDAARWLTEQGSQLFDGAQVEQNLARSVDRWSAADPQAAAKFAAELPLGNDPAYRDALKKASRRWSRRDPQAAFDWAKSLSDANPQKVAALDGALVGFTGLYPAQAAAYVQQQAVAAPDAGRLIALVASEWAQNDPRAAEQWAGALASPAARQTAFRELADAWTRVDTPAAVRWASALPAADRARGGAWGAIAAAWSATDPGGTDHWLGTLAPGPDRDQAVSAYAGSIAQANPERGLAWLQTTGDDRFFAEQSRRILGQWLARDYAAASAWAVANNMPLPNRGER